MMTEIRKSAFDPLLTTRAQFDLALAPPETQLLIDGDGQTVFNAVDRTDDPAVLITGNNNTFINEAGATLTGTGTSIDPLDAEAAIEVIGTGNIVENQSGATIAGAVGVFSSVAGTEVQNDGDILVVGGGSSFFDGSVAILVESESEVVNGGVIRAEANDQATGISTEDLGNVRNDGTIEVSGGEFADAIDVGEGSTVVNTGTIDVTAGIDSTGILASGPGSTLSNSGTIRSTSTDAFSNAFGMSSFSSGDDTALIWNGGIVEAHAVGGGNSNGIVAQGGRFENEGTVNATATTGSDLGTAVGAFLNRSDGANTGTISAVSDGEVSVGVVSLFEGAFDNEGLISATGPRAAGFNGVGDVALTNSGTIFAAGAAASAVLLDGNTTVTNSGLITAEADAGGQPAIGIELGEAADSRHTINNSGTITADVAVAYASTPFGQNGSVLTLVNSGQINGAVNLAGEVDLVTNTGTIAGDVDLGAGNDVFDGRGGQVDGAVLGGDGDDVLRGGDGSDILNGGAGNDIVAGGAGADVMDGGTRDPFGFGFDALDYSDSPEGVQVNLGDATQSTSAPVKGAAGTGFGGHAEGDTFQNFQKVIGSDFDDFVYGADGGSVVELGNGNDTFDNDATLFTEDLVDLGAGNDIARTGAGDDFVEGGAGNDLLQGEDGGDFLLGEEGNDLLIGGNGFDLLDGGADADALFGGADGDALFGREGGDLLVGGDGDDLLDGGAGNDLLLGGAGDDFFTFGLDGGQDRIIGFEAGAGSEDVVDLSAFSTIVSFDDVLAIASETGSGAFASTVLTFDAATTLTFQGVQLAELNEADFLIV